MISNDAPIAGDAPQPLKRRALFELRREEMRRRGEPTDDISEDTPMSSRISYTLSQLDAQEEEFYQQYPQHRPGPLVNPNRGWISPSPSERKRIPGYEPSCNAEEEGKLEDGHSRQDAPDLQAVPHPSKLPRSKRRAARFAARVKNGLDELRMRIRNMREAAAGRQGPHQGGRRSRSSRAASWSRAEIRPAGKMSPDEPINPADSADLHEDSEIDLNYERQQLADDMLAAARPNSRDFFRTSDPKAFPGDDPAQETDPSPESALPAGLFPHRRVDGAIELGSYLASSAYIISLGGRPLPDLQYGVIIVPVGDESLLFRGYGDHAAMSPEHVEEIYAKSKAAEKVEKVELWKKMQQEWWDEFRNPGGSEPGEGLDEDDIEFLRQRWLARRARLAKKDDGSEDASRAMTEAASQKQDGAATTVGKQKAPEEIFAAESQQYSQDSPAPEPLAAVAGVNKEVGLGGAATMTEDHDAASTVERAATDSENFQTAGQQDPDSHTPTDEAAKADSSSLRSEQPASTAASVRSNKATVDPPQSSAFTAVSATPTKSTTPPITQPHPMPSPSLSPSPQTLRPSTSASASAITSNNATTTAAEDTAEDAAEEQCPPSEHTLSAEACRALETLLRGTHPSMPPTALEEQAQNTKKLAMTKRLTKTKSKKGSRGFRALLRRKRHGDAAAVSVAVSPALDDNAAIKGESSANSSDAVTAVSRAVVLEVAAAVDRMARGEMRENPGVDAGVWRAVRKVFALPA